MCVEVERIGARPDMVIESIKTCEKAVHVKNLHSERGCITESSSLHVQELCPRKIPSIF